MNIKRRDRKNRILRQGESQRSDGRYVYKYTDTNGQQKFVYSWKLEATDRTPTGKRDDLSLREKIKLIEKDLHDGIVPNGGNSTVLELVEKYILQKTGVRSNTQAGYKTVVNILVSDKFGARQIGSVRQSDAKEWLIKLNKSGKGYSSIQNIRGVLRPAFQMAVDDDLIRKNPFQFELASIIANDSVTREAISTMQERAFLEFVRQDEHFAKYYDGIFILFKTGLRISEFVGLTIADIDMRNRTINVDHQLQRTREGQYYIESPKTGAGARVLPMSAEVYDCFKRILENRRKPRVEPMIQGKVGFLYLDKNGNPTLAMHWEKYFQHICKKYNSIHMVQMPKVTPHVCRHTYCSNMAKSGMNPKTLQFLMGHSDISITLNTYTHVGLEDAIDEIERLQLAQDG